MAAIPGAAPRATGEGARPALRLAPPAGAANDSALERAWARLRRLAADYAVLGVLDLRRAAVQLAWLVGAFDDVCKGEGRSPPIGETAG